MSTFVIAEAGSCHDGEFDKALELVEEAADCGADAIKFQYWSDPKKLAERRNAPAYLEVYRKYAVPHAWLEPLAKHAEKCGIEFMCTCYYEEDISKVAPFVSAFKVASFEALDEKFIKAHFKYKKTVIVSTGMTHFENVAWMLNLEHRIILLHCVSAYPCPIDQLNLSAMQSLSKGTNRYGLSDHTTELMTGALAVAMGAGVLEKHFRLDSTEYDNPDYRHSLSTARFAAYVENVRTAEKAMGDGAKQPQKCEKAMMPYQVRP